MDAKYNRVLEIAVGCFDTSCLVLVVVVGMTVVVGVLAVIAVNTVTGTSTMTGITSMIGLIFLIDLIGSRVLRNIFARKTSLYIGLAVPQ